MDTSYWATYPVGRYLIDLPPTAQFYWYPLRFARKFDLVWQKGMNIEEANALLRKEAEIAKQSPHETNENCFIEFHENYGANGLGSILICHPNAYSDSYLFKFYVVGMTPLADSNLEQRVYYYEEQVVNIPDFIENGIKFVNWLASSIASTDPSLPYDVVSGAYFEGGMLYGPSDIPWTREEIGIEVSFPEYPGIQFSIFFDHLRMNTEEGNPNTTIAGNPAKESLETFSENGILHYAFTLNAASKEDKFEQPLILMHIHNPIGGIMRDGVSTIKPPIRRPSFASEEEAIEFWNAIKESIRWRPDNWIVDAPDFPYYIVNKEIVRATLPDENE